MRVAFLTTRLAPHFVTDDDLALAPLRRRGIEVESVRWREPVEWAAYDLVVIRSPWDYQHDLERFLGVLAGIEAAGTRLENPLELVRWNARKGYLRELAAGGVATVPTLWLPALEPGALTDLFRESPADELVLKPVVGASGEDAFRVARGDAAALEPRLLETFRDRAVMVQPFLERVLEEGELSIVLVDGRVSHALRKVPIGGEFRSQEEWGSRILPVDVPSGMDRIAEGILARAVAAARAAGGSRSAATGRVGAAPLYARADFLPGGTRGGDPGGRRGWLLGELELIEPALYLRTHPAAPERFAAALRTRFHIPDSPPSPG